MAAILAVITLVWISSGKVLSFRPIQNRQIQPTRVHPLTGHQERRQHLLAATRSAEETTTSMETSVADDERFRELAFRISWSFQPREFRPPRLLTNCHLQTISGVFLRNDPKCRYVTGEEDLQVALEKGRKLLKSLSEEPDTYGDFWDLRQRVNTPDGDFFHVDYKYHSNEIRNPSSKGLVIILHGLQSNSNSSLSVDMGKAYLKHGFDVACMNFRGCSGVPNDSLRAYHLGFTDDLKRYLSLLNSGEKKPPPIFISGFSLGANVVLKALGELGPSAFREFNIYGAAVSGAPFDNERNIGFVQRAGFNKFAYNDSLLKSMKKSALAQLERFPDSPEAKKLNYEEIAKTTEISAFENAVIAPIFGFKNNIDYYRKTNCLKFLDEIRVPTLIMNAADDPFFDPTFFPYEKGCHSSVGREKKSPITLVRSDYGGHLGFMFHRRDETEDEAPFEEVSFMPSELARFVNHVFERRAWLEKREIVWQ